MPGPKSPCRSLSRYSTPVSSPWATSGTAAALCTRSRPGSSISTADGLGAASTESCPCRAALIARLRSEARDADDPAPFRRNPDQADTNRHLGSHARRHVAVARNCEQPVAALVRGEEDRIGESEQVVERLEPDAGSLGVFDAEGQPAHELVEERKHVPLGRALFGRRRRGAQREAADDTVNVDATQPEDVGHPHLRGDRSQIHLDLVEDRPLALGVEVAEVERELVAVPGIDDDHLRLRVHVQVRPRLVEELARKSATRSEST